MMLANPKTLIVKDTYFNQVLVESLLNSWGIETITCKDAKKGLAALTENEINLIILDLMMPGMDGFEFLSRKRQMKDETPVIVVSGKVDSEAIARALELGAKEFITKPIKSEVSQAAINIHIKPH